MRLTRLLLALALLAAPLAAHQLQQPQVTAIRADRLLVGDGTQIVSPVVLVTGERITAVGTAPQVTIPGGARVIELRGQTLLPGEFADLVAVAGNPLEDITRLRRPAFVMQAGAVVVAPASCADCAPRLK